MNYKDPLEPIHTVTLLHNTPLSVCAHAVRTCWQSHEKGDDGGDLDKALVYKVGNVYKHASTLEHLVYHFYIQGISRALLQELARHRLASLSVKSTRYTLKELQGEESFKYWEVNNAATYVVLTGNATVDQTTVAALEGLRAIVACSIPNDLAKFALPDAYKTELTWTINARSLQNFLSLRTAKSAMWEIRKLAYQVYDTLPEEHKYLFKDFVIEVSVVDNIKEGT